MTQQDRATFRLLQQKRTSQTRNGKRVCYVQWKSVAGEEAGRCAQEGPGGTAAQGQL